MRKQPGVSWEEWFIRLFLPLSPGRLLRHGPGLVALWVAGMAVVPPLLLAAIMAPPCYLCALVTAWYYNRTSGRPAAVWTSSDRRAACAKDSLSYRDREFVDWMRQHGVPASLGRQFIENW
jgi:hypothetical protein